MPKRVVEASVSRKSRMWSHQRLRNRGCPDRLKAYGDSNVSATAGSSAPDVLEILAGLEADRPAGRDADFLAGSWVTADPPLPRLHLEHAEAAQLDPFAALHRKAHR